MNYDLDTEDGMSNSVAWTQHTFDMLNEGGVWHVPRSNTTIIVYHKTKTAHISRGHKPDPSIERVIKAMGWTVTRNKVSNAGQS